MTTRGADKTVVATLLGVVAPIQANAVQSLTDWRDWIKDYNLAIAGITATLIALWWVIRLVRFGHETYVAVFARPAQRDSESPRRRTPYEDGGEV